MLRNLGVLDGSDEPFHLAVFVKIELVRSVNETLSRVLRHGPSNLHLFLLPIRNVTEFILLAFLKSTEKVSLHADDAPRLPVKASNIVLGVEFKRTYQVTQFSWCGRHIFVLHACYPCNSWSSSRMRCNKTDAGS